MKTENNQEYSKTQHSNILPLPPQQPRCLRLTHTHTHKGKKKKSQISCILEQEI